MDFLCEICNEIVDMNSTDWCANEAGGYHNNCYDSYLGVESEKYRTSFELSYSQRQSEAYGNSYKEDSYLEHVIEMADYMRE